MKIAIVMTAFNRKNKTIECLKSLQKQVNMPPFDVYLCDDGSTDGTKEAVVELFDNVKIIQGTGSLFWSRGMAMAMAEAVNGDYDYFLMVNDDVIFKDDMWEIMHRSMHGCSECAVTGCTQSAITNKLTYSGARFFQVGGKRFVSEKIEPSKNEKRTCDVANWNCFLISDRVVKEIGLIDSIYEHSFGDFDYSLRMRKADLPIYISEEYIGYCENNSRENTYRDGNLPRKKRIQKILAPTGLPIHSWFVFTKRHYGAAAFRNFVVPYLKFVMAVILKRDC